MLLMRNSPHKEPEQKRPQASDAVEAYINILRTADWLLRETEKLLAAAGLTPPQYNVLRILRGAARAEGKTDSGLPCREIGARMITRDPDITRLLDRLENAGLVIRARDAQDRRVVNVKIATDGMRLLKRLDQPVRELNERQMRVLGRSGTRNLIEQLEKLRVGEP